MIPLSLNTDLFLKLFFNKRRFITFLIHWAFWLLLHFISYFPTFFNAPHLLSGYFYTCHILIATLNFLLFYSVAFFIIPQLGIKQKKWNWVMITSIILAIVCTYLKYQLLHLFTANKLVSQEMFGFFYNRFSTYFATKIPNNISFIILAFAYRLSVNWYQQEKIQKQLENQKLRAELSFLKMQVNPHFLFNALNNIYSLAVTEKCNRTGDSIMKLSELMRYVLYEKEDEEHKVILEKEINHINNYIDLEKLRHEGNIFVNFSIEGEFRKKRVHPLLLFPLIENAFKHGILTVPEKPVSIELKVNDQFLDVSIKNFINNHIKDEEGGIGIQNVRKRLDLLYGYQHALKVKQSGDQYIVKLHLPL